MATYRLGIDVGSTTAKIVILDQDGNRVFSQYGRHNASIAKTVCEFLETVPDVAGRKYRVGVTGSIGMGIAGRSGISFVQEVVAASKAVPLITGRQIASMIDIGGEDSKVVYFNGQGEPSDLRMNGNCAAGTGSFIDQMAIILGESIDALSDLALRATHIYPIASRCGVFCKTDIQNLVAKNASKADIAASIFHAVAVQTVVTLAHGFDITPPVLFCGGPLHFCPTLVRVFAERLQLASDQVLLPDHSETFVAFGAAIVGSRFKGQATMTVGEMLACLEKGITNSKLSTLNSQLSSPLFSSEEEKSAFLARHSAELAADGGPKTIVLKGQGEMPVWLGIDSGSTTSKTVILDEQLKLLDSRYGNNHGDPLAVVRDQLNDLYRSWQQRGVELYPLGLGTTGYGAEMVARAFRADYSIVETIAHAEACRHYIPDTDFILDIGGQDMKAIWLRDGVITNILVNEACSSGCGSFLENFSHSLGIPVDQIAAHAFASRNPARLGSRCTVFMTSTIINEQRNGRNADDLMAGLCRSIIENVFTKVVRVGNTDTLGHRVVVQGGTFRNLAVVRAIEEYLARPVTLAPYPGLMGAIGIAILTAKRA